MPAPGPGWSQPTHQPQKDTHLQRRKNTARKEPFLFGLEAHHSLSSQAALFLCTAHFVLVSLGVPARAEEQWSTYVWSPTIQLILSHKHRLNKVSGCFLFLHILKMVTRSSFHFCPLHCPCFLNTELSPPGHSKVAGHVFHLEAWKGVLLGQHHSEVVCPPQGGLAEAAEPPG